jgi:regulator of sigma E protease
VIGVASPRRLKLYPPEARKVRAMPVLYNSPAAAARVMDLQPGDVVVRCTDPSDASKVTDLPKKPAAAFAELCRRMAALPRDVLELYVQAKDAPAGTEPKRVVVPVKGFDFGDRIVATTDPDTPDQPFKVKQLPPDPSNPKDDARDPFEFFKRMKQLAGKPAVVQVVRDKAKDGEPGGPEADKNPETVNILVPPAFHWTLGMTMKIGKVAAIRDGSPASKTDLKASPDEADGDDLIGLQLAFIGKGPDGKDQALREEVLQVSRVDPQFVPKGAEVVDVDPMRLPDLLARRVADGRKALRDRAKDLKVLVTAIVLRQINNNPPQQKKLEQAMAWDDSWDFQQEYPVNLTSPLSIPQLGFAYRVTTMVDKVQPNSPATEATEVLKAAGFWDWLKWFFGSTNERKREKEGPVNAIQRDDQLQKIRFLQAARKVGEGTWTGWREMKSERRRNGNKVEVFDQWPHFFWVLQNSDYPEIEVQVHRGGKLLDKPLLLRAKQDLSWPLADRGLLLVPDSRLQTVDSTAEAVLLGVDQSLSFIKRMYLNLASLIRGRISTRTLGGPIELASQTFAAADDPYILLLWLGMISLNLAVVNFLPIPVLDGGHMVFLIWEKIRGRPPSEAVRAAATYVGLAVIFSLMLFVFCQDIMKRILGWWM